MTKEGWIYCGTNKNPDLEGYIKIGKSVNTASSRENNTNGAGYNIFFAVKVDNCEFYEQLIHKMFEEFNYQNNSNARRKKDNWQEWFNVKFENLLPFLLEISTDFEIRDEDYCTKICKTITENNDLYKILIKREPNKYQKLNQQIKENYGNCPLLNELLDKMAIHNNSKNQTSQDNKKMQSQNQNKVCKYEVPNKTRTTINWNLFFNNNQQLLHKNVYVDKNKNNIGVIAPFSNGKFGILFKNKEMSFMDFCKFNGHTNCCAYNHIYFLDTNKTIKETYEELKFS